MKTCLLTLLTLFAFSAASVVTPAISIAGPVPSGFGTAPSQRAADLDRIHELLGDPQVQEALQRAGTDVETVRLRLAEMNDHDVHQLSQRMGDVKSGGVIVWVLTIVVLVLAALYLWKRV